MTDIQPQVPNAREPAGSADQLATAVMRIFRLADAWDWRSYDPYDLLDSPLLAGLQAHWVFGARVAIQVGRRTGTGLRGLLGVRRHQEAETLSDFLAAALLFSRSGYSWADGYVEPLLTRLISQRIPTAHGAGWGLEFPRATRFVNVPARTPNLYQTTRVVQSLFDAYEHSDSGRAADAARSGVRCIVDDLGSVRRDGNLWFRYWPELDEWILNVEALAAATLARAARLFGDEALGVLSDEAARTVCAMQRKPGYWFYEETRARYIDGFHTGFILEALHDYRRHRGERAIQIEPVYSRGLRYFDEHLITKGGMPRLYADGEASTVSQNAAQAIQTLVVCGNGRDDVRRALRLWRRVSTAARFDQVLTRPNRLKELLTPRYPALRWSAGPLALARGHLVQALRALEEPTL